MEDETLRAELARLHDEERRQNRRIEILEESVRAIQELTISVHALAHDMKQMLEEQKEQGKRLDQLEAAPAKAWKGAKQTVINTIIGAFAGAFASGVIYIIAQINL